MKPHFFYSFLLIFALFSCGEEEEIPVTPLNGTYLGNLLLSGDNPQYVEMTFGPDGTLTVAEYVLTDSNSRCFKSISSGTYSLKGNEFSYTINTFHGVDPDTNESGCASPTDLQENQENSGLIQVAYVEFKSEWDVFEISYPCYDMIPNARTTLCIGYSDFVLQD